MQIMVILNDMPEKTMRIESDCLIANLQAFDCRKGCSNCGANELFAKLESAYDKKGYDSGKFYFLKDCGHKRIIRIMIFRCKT